MTSVVYMKTGNGWVETHCAFPKGTAFCCVADRSVNFTGLKI